MDGVIITVVAMYVVLAVITGVIAADKGRSGFGWFLLGLLFPIAILFVCIANPLSRK